MVTGIKGKTLGEMEAERLKDLSESRQFELSCVGAVSLEDTVRLRIDPVPVPSRPFAAMRFYDDSEIIETVPVRPK